MKYLLDSSVIVDHLRGKKEIDSAFLREGSAISIITQAELFYGAYKSKKPQQNLKKVRQMLTDLRIEVIPLSEDILASYGQTKVKLEKRGKSLDEFDLLIAATALSLNLSLTTGNLKHFKRISKLKLKS